MSTILSLFLKKRKNGSYLLGFLWELNEIMHSKYQVQCLAQSKHTINISLNNSTLDACIKPKWKKIVFLEFPHWQDMVPGVLPRYVAWSAQPLLWLPIHFNPSFYHEINQETEELWRRLARDFLMSQLQVIKANMVNPTQKGLTGSGSTTRCLRSEPGWVNRTLSN